MHNKYKVNYKHSVKIKVAMITVSSRCGSIIQIFAFGREAIFSVWFVFCL